MARQGVAGIRTRLQQQGSRLIARAPAPVQRAWELAERTVRDTLADRVPGLAAECALFTLISLPALLLVVLGSLGFLADSLGPDGADELRRLVFEVPESFLSASTYDSYSRVASSIVEEGRGDVVGFGLVLGIWTGSRAVNRYLETITLAYDLEPRAGWRRRLLALGLTVGALVSAVALFPPLVLGPRLIEWVAPDAVASATLDLLGLLYWPALVSLVLAALATLYHLAAPWRTPWIRDLPGAALAMVLWLLASGGLRAYLAVSVQDDAVYSQLGTPIAVVLWFYVTALAVLLGAELNAEIEKMWPTRDRDARDQSPNSKNSPPNV